MSVHAREKGQRARRAEIALRQNACQPTLFVHRPETVDVVGAMTCLEPLAEAKIASAGTRRAS